MVLNLKTSSPRISSWKQAVQLFLSYSPFVHFTSYQLAVFGTTFFCFFFKLHQKLYIFQDIKTFFDTLFMLSWSLFFIFFRGYLLIPVTLITIVCSIQHRNLSRQTNALNTQTDSSECNRQEFCLYVFANKWGGSSVLFCCLLFLFFCPPCLCAKIKKKKGIKTNKSGLVST